MTVSPSKPMEGKIYYIKKSFRDGKGRCTSKNVRRLGTFAEIREREKVTDPWIWIQDQVKAENLKEAEGHRSVSVTFNPDKQLVEGQQRCFNIGYLILNKLYYELGIDKICAGITRRGQFKFDLNEIMRQLVIMRVLWPKSKLGTWEMSGTLALVIPVSLHQIYRGLLALEKHLEYLQERLFHYSKDLLGRNTSIIYYDCTNFFFESKTETGLRRPGASKENRRTPIVQMGIFMDADGLPLAFNINPGNTNEQTTLRPLEKMIGRRMDIEEFIMCTDAGLSSGSNKLYNDDDKRKFITVQSVKTLPNKEGKPKTSGKIKDWALADGGWFLPSDPETEYTLTEIKKEENRQRFYNETFYKERWFPTWVEDAETGIETVLHQRCIVSFSLKYMDYQRKTRDRNIEKAQRSIENGNAADPPKNFRSYIKRHKCTETGEVADIDAGFSIDTERVAEEEQYDGFYAICTNLQQHTDKLGHVHHTVADLLKINRARWEIEESFRIMKTQMRARPVYLRDDRTVKAHFAMCFVALFLYRVLEHRMGEGFTTDGIMDALRDMNALRVESEGFVPTFKRTKTTDRLFEISGFRMDYKILTLKKLKSIAAMTRG